MYLKMTLYHKLAIADACYNQALLQSFLITYISVATYQKLFIFGIGVPGKVLFHSISIDPLVMPGRG